MGPDKRVYRFLQETRYGRKVLAEIGQTSPRSSTPVTKYLAQRLLERGARAARRRPCCPAARAISSTRCAPSAAQRRRRALKAFLFGVLVGVASLIAAALIFGPKS